MKIAVVTDDGATISSHFGRARYYVVLTVEEQRVLAREMIDRAGTILPANEKHQARQGLGGEIDCHGSGTAAATSHLRMIQPIRVEPVLFVLVLLTAGCGSAAATGHLRHWQPPLCRRQLRQARCLLPCQLPQLLRLRRGRWSRRRQPACRPRPVHTWTRPSR